MSLNIDCRYVTAIYALGQWFSVVPGSVDVDAYEFINWEEDLQPGERRAWDTRGTSYQMGTIYPEREGPNCGTFGENSGLSWANPCGSHGIVFLDADTGERVSFSLAEVRAFRERRLPEK